MNKLKTNYPWNINPWLKNFSTLSLHFCKNKILPKSMNVILK